MYANMPSATTYAHSLPMTSHFPLCAKTRRSHEENQERAYIAASRRSDRSLEARIQSAKMASEVHKKRTGKGFYITEEIVRNEEMYEEEEDVFPRISFSILGPHMLTSSSQLNERMEAYAFSKMYMHNLYNRGRASWQEDDIHKEFASTFPNYNTSIQQQVPRQSSTQDLNTAQDSTLQWQNNLPSYPPIDSSGTLMTAGDMYETPTTPTGNMPFTSTEPAECDLTAYNTQDGYGLDGSQASSGIDGARDSFSGTQETHNDLRQSGVFTSQLPQDVMLLLKDPRSVNIGKEDSYPFDMMDQDYTEDAANTNVYSPDLEFDDVPNTPEGRGNVLDTSPDDQEATCCDYGDAWDLFIDSAALDGNDHIDS